MFIGINVDILSFSFQCSFRLLTNVNICLTRCQQKFSICFQVINITFTILNYKIDFDKYKFYTFLLLNFIISMSFLTTFIDYQENNEMSIKDFNFFKFHKRV